MTLAEHAQFICGKINQTEAEDLAACKGFLRQRFVMLWADQLWKDSLVSYTQTLEPTGYTPASTWLPASGVLLCPPLIERVIAVRSDTRHLNVQRPEFYYRVDLDVFVRTGLASEFVLLPPCVWEWDETVRLFLWRGNEADAGASVKADLLNANAVDVDRATVMLAQQYDNSLGSTKRLDNLLKLATAGAVSLRAATAMWTLTNNSGVSADFYTHVDPSNWFILRATLAPGQTAQVPASNMMTATVVGQPGYILAQVAAPFGASTSGAVSFLNEDELIVWFDNGATQLTLAAADTAAKLRQRIRLVNIPDAALTIRVLGKRSAPPFSDDLDTPGLTGVENCLLAFAQGDMLQRERHYAKAQALYQEGQLLLNQLKLVETVQQAHEQRIIPEGGYGGEEWDRLYGFSF